MTGRNLVVSGGPLHDFAGTTAALVDVIDACGLRSTVLADPGAALDQAAEDPGWDLITVNALLWSMPAERHAALRDAWAFRLGDHQGAALLAHVERGGALLACHAAPICFDGDARWRALIGATWDWDRSHHPPLGSTVIRPAPAGAAHPITRGTAAFDLVDEVYADLDLDADVVPLLVGTVDGRDQPVLWARTVGRGRVVVDLLGHHPQSLAHPTHTAVLRRAVAWLGEGAPLDTRSGPAPVPKAVR